MIFWLQRGSIAVLVAVVLAVIIRLFFLPHQETMLRRGDFPGFYVLAIILERGENKNLYDRATQTEIENEFWPEMAGKVLLSVYPPYTAFLLQPLASFSPPAAQAIFTFFMLGCLLGASFLAMRLSHTPALLPLLAGSLLFQPVFAGTLGAQNTALSMLLSLLVAFSLQHKSAKAFAAAGMAAAAWMLKPQFGIFALLFLSVRSPKRAMWLGTLAVLFLYYFFAWKSFGFHWVAPWLEAVFRFSPENFAVNQFLNTSLASNLAALLSLSSLTLPELFLSPLILFAFLIDFYQQRTLSAEKHFLLLLAALPLLSPQTLFYDLGISWGAFLAAGALCSKRGLCLTGTAILLSWLAAELRGLFPPSPYLFVGLFLYFSTHFLLRGKEAD